MKKTNSLIAIIIILSCLGNIFAQSKTSSIWIKATANKIAAKNFLNNNSYENASQKYSNSNNRSHPKLPPFSRLFPYPYTDHL